MDPRPHSPPNHQGGLAGHSSDNTPTQKSRVRPDLVSGLTRRPPGLPTTTATEPGQGPRFQEGSRAGVGFYLDYRASDSTPAPPSHERRQLPLHTFQRGRRPLLPPFQKTSNARTHHTSSQQRRRGFAAAPSRQRRLDAPAGGEVAIGVGQRGHRRELRPSLREAAFSRRGFRSDVFSCCCVRSSGVVSPHCGPRCSRRKTSSGRRALQTVDGLGLGRPPRPSAS